MLNVLLGSYSHISMPILPHPRQIWATNLGNYQSMCAKGLYVPNFWCTKKNFNFEKYSKILKLAIFIQSANTQKVIAMIMCEIRESKI